MTFAGVERRVRLWGYSSQLHFCSKNERENGCTLPAWRDLPSRRKKEQGGSPAGLGRCRGAWDSSGRRWGWSGAGRALLSRGAVPAAWGSVASEPQATSGSTGSSVQPCCGDGSPSGCISSPLTHLGFCSSPIELAALVGDADPCLYSARVFLPVVPQPRQPGGIWGCWSSPRVSCPGATKLQFPFFEGCGTGVGSAGAGGWSWPGNIIFSVLLSRSFCFPPTLKSSCCYGPSEHQVLVPTYESLSRYRAGRQRHFITQRKAPAGAEGLHTPVAATCT